MGIGYEAAMNYAKNFTNSLKGSDILDSAVFLVVNKDENITYTLMKDIHIRRNSSNPNMGLKEISVSPEKMYLIELTEKKDNSSQPEYEVTYMNEVTLNIGYETIINEENTFIPIKDISPEFIKKLLSE